MLTTAYPWLGPILTPLIGVLGTGGLATWSAFGHTDSAKLAAVEALLPEGGKIVVPARSVASDSALAIAVADTTRPKIVAQ
jgi:hypothetical protein